MFQETLLEWALSVVKTMRADNDLNIQEAMHLVGIPKNHQDDVQRLEELSFELFEENY
jgi:hypothetical protein